MNWQRVDKYKLLTLRDEETVIETIFTSRMRSGYNDGSV